jgi:hypothetical protein
MQRGACIVFALAALAGAGCESPRYEINWNRLHAGMSRAEVESMLGQPSSTYVPPPADPNAVRPRSSARGERWQYGDTLSSFGTRAMFPDEADERAWCVFFGPDGTVNGFRPASWATNARSKDPVDVPAQPSAAATAR